MHSATIIRCFMRIYSLPIKSVTCTLDFSFKLIFSGFFVFICFFVLLTRPLRRVYVNGFFRNNGLLLRWTKRGGRILSPVVSLAIFQSLERLFTFFKKMFHAFLGRPGGTLSLQTTTTEVRNIYMVYQQVISLVSLSRPQRFFGSLLDASFYRLFNILHWTSSTPSSTDSIVRGATADI